MDRSGCRVRLHLILLPLQFSYDALLPPGGFAGALPLPGFVKDEAATAGFGFSFFGFFASRLPRCSPLAIDGLHCQ
jgi:hypothetical protein